MPKSTAEEALEKVAKEVFDSENAVPQERSYANLDAYHRHYESMLRDVERKRNETKLKPVLEMVRAKYNRDYEGFVTYIEGLVYRSGCSKALAGLLMDYSDDRVDFARDLYRNFPNSRYNYSQAFIEEMRFYGKSTDTKINE